MSENLIIGCMTISICLAIQCGVITIMLRILLILEKKQLIKLSFVGASSLLIAVMLIMMVGNLVQMTLWAELFLAYGEFEDFAASFYHSVVNFSTLGYGDHVMSEQRRLLGALEATNGVLMFGLTTGFLYTIMSVFMRRAWDMRMARSDNMTGGQ